MQKYGQSKIFQDKEHHDSSRKGFRFLEKGFQKLRQLIHIGSGNTFRNIRGNIQSIGKNCCLLTNSFKIEKTKIGKGQKITKKNIVQDTSK